ncbi:MAG: DUF3368 domain-containing protein [Chthoniobacteraceae bacterium]
MLVVSDTSPVTALLQTGLAHLLPALFRQIIIPPAVLAELERAHAVLPGWLEVRTPLAIPDSLRAAHLDPGETEAIAIAMELAADAILIDEQMGRRAAHGLHLSIMGLLGVLLLAKRTGHLASVRPAILALRQDAGCWFAEPLVADVLRAAGES